MRNLLGYMAWTLLAVAISIPCPAQAPAKASADKNTVRDKLVGAWRLAWEEEPGADGKIARVERTGTLLYTRDGHMSVQIMLPTPESSSASGPVQYEQNGYEGYFGTYEVDERARTVTHYVEGALVRSLIGHNLTRVYKFSGKQLILTSSRSDEHWTIAWEHY
jgi:hypothetical protein